MDLDPKYNINMDFVVHMTIDQEVIPDYDIDYAIRVVSEIIANSEFAGKIVIRPLSEVIAC